MLESTPRAMREIALQHETQAIQHLRREVSATMHEPRDELLFAVLILMRSTDNISTLQEPKTLGAFRPPLTHLQNLHTGSSLSYGTAQREMLRSLVSQKGGLTNIVMPGLAEFFNVYVQSLTGADDGAYQQLQYGSLPSELSYGKTRL